MYYINPLVSILYEDIVFLLEKMESTYTLVCYFWIWSNNLSLPLIFKPCGGWDRSSPFLQIKSAQIK